MKSIMKSMLCIVSVFALLLTIMSGCSNPDQNTSELSEKVSQESSNMSENSLTESSTDSEDTASTSESVTNIVESTIDREADLDLTTLSSTMVYAEVYNIVTNPDTYRGKTVKMTGNLATYHDEETGQDYFACIIPDATACCSQGIEFRTTDKYSYPEDYPEIGQNITVIGTFDTYKEKQFEYAVLDKAEIL